MTTPRPSPSSDMFSALRGALTENAPLGAESWFACGGTADLLFRPADAEDLSAFLRIWPAAEKLTIVGGLANTIVRDGGVRGAVIRPGKPFADVKVIDDHYIEAGTGALNGTVAASAVKAGIGGLEFLSGIPGMVGGALTMNAGAYGTEVKDVLVGVNALGRDGRTHRLTPDDLHMSYRHTHVEEWMVFISAVFRGVKEDYDTVKSRMNDIKAARNETQPIRERTGGSTFANPAPSELRKAGLPEDTRAWQVVEKVGGRGLQIGGARMSDMHCNFMINTGDATATNLEMLGEEIRKRARNDLGLDLRWEIRRIGEQP